MNILYKRRSVLEQDTAKQNRGTIDMHHLDRTTRASRRPSLWGARTLGWLLVLSAILSFLGCNNVTVDVGEARGETPRDEDNSTLKASAPLAANGPITDTGDIKLRLMKHTLVLVKTNYYDPSRVDWKNMMAHAFDGLQSTIAEVVAEFEVPPDAKPNSVNLRVNTKSRTFDLSNIKSLTDVHELSIEVAKFVMDNVKEELKLTELEYTLINGMLDTLDPHSILLTPKVYEDMQTSHGGFGGLGIVIGIRDEELTIISPIEGTPASRAGLKAGDKITQIGEESTINMPLHEAVDRLRGEVGEPIDVYVLRKGWTEPRVFNIVRAQIEIHSLTTHAIKDDKIAYIKIKAFEKNTAEDMLKALKEMREEMGEVKGLILDLRFNAGGLLNQAIKVADAFLPEGKVIVVTEGIAGTERDEERSTNDDTEPDYPIVVIINPGSASASEIVAGALKNHDRAVLIGDQTFGKGSVQILRDNDDGSAIKLTIAQYLTPGDISIQGVGIAPDVRVVPVLITEKEGIDMFVSENIRREGSLDLSLQSEKVRAPNEPVAVVRYLFDEAEADKDNGEDFYEDFEIQMARAFLTKSHSPKGDELLSGAQDSLAKFEASGLKEITAALAKLDVDWSAPKKPLASQPFEAKVELVGAEGNTVKAGQTVTLRATVTNTGDKDINRLFAISHSNNPVFDDQELVFGKVEPGKSKSWNLEIKVPRGGEPREDVVNLAFGDANGQLSQDVSQDIISEGLPRPHYAYSYQIDDREGGNGDGLLQKGETINLIVNAENNGLGDSEETFAYIASDSGAAMLLSKGRDTVGPLPVGGTGRALLRFDVKGAKEKTSNLAFVLTIYDKEFGSRVEETIELPVLESDASPSKATGFVTFAAKTPIYGGASVETDPIASAEAQEVLAVTANSADGTMVRVAWGEGENAPFGWVAAKDTQTAQGPAKGSPAVVVKKTSPFVSFDPQALVVNADHLEVTGLIKDDGTVTDYRVFLWHRQAIKTHAQKLDYGLGGRDEKKFAVDVPLREGVNRITVVARDDQKLENSETIYVVRP